MAFRRFVPLLNSAFRAQARAAASRLVIGSARVLFAPRYVRGVAVVAASGVGLASTVAYCEAPKVNWEQVKNDIKAILEEPNYDDGHIGPLLIRLAWHASGTYDAASKTGGSDGATMRFLPESGHGANAGLIEARKRLEKIAAKHPGLSISDLWILASYVAIEDMGGPKIPFRPGRQDLPSGEYCTPDGRLPDADGRPIGGVISKPSTIAHIRHIFYRMGFNDQEIVALSGAHALGRCHTDRSGYTGPWTRAPTTFSNEYFRLLIESKWVKKNWKGPLQYENTDGGDLMMLPTDIALIDDPSFRKYVEIYSKDEARFFKDFAAAYKKLTELGCERLQGSNGKRWIFF